MAKFGYVGNQPDSTPVIVARQIHTATGPVGIITFNSGYTPGYLDVYLNGIKLVDAQDYSAADGRTVNIISNAVAGDTLEMVAYKAFNLSLGPVGVASAGTIIKADSVTTLNFIGAGNTFAVNGSTVDISISGGGGGLGTALSSDALSPLSKIFKTPRILNIGAGSSILVESDSTSDNTAFMRERDVYIAVGATFTVGSGTTLITNVLSVF